MDTNTNPLLRPLTVGDWVIVSGDDDYAGLTGQVTEIVPHGSPEHDTGNPTDDIFVDLSLPDYSSNMKAEITAKAQALGYSLDSYWEVPLDSIILVPDNLVRITEQELSQYEAELTSSLEDAESLGNKLAAQHCNQLEDALIERVEQNYSDFKASLLDFGKDELIDMAAVIHAHSDAHAYMTERRGYDESELSFYLQFVSPLEIVADAWRKYINGQAEMSYVMNTVFERKDTITAQYALVESIVPYEDISQQRFMNVDLVDFLGKIAEKVIVHHPDDWNIDNKYLHRAALSDNPDDKRLMWHVSSYGTHMNTERETFIKDTGAFNTWVDYRPHEPDMFGYVIEVTGMKGDVITGNVFEVGDYYPHTLHVRDSALIFTEVSLTYSNDWGANAGKTVMVPRFEYDRDRHRLMSESGAVTAVEYHPYEGVRTMADLLQQERSHRMAYPMGSPSAHIESLSEKLAEIRQPFEQEKPASSKEISTFDKALNRGKEKAEAYKAQSAQNHTHQKSKQEEL